MVEVRLLAPLTDSDGNEHKVDEILDVDVEQAEAWRAAGKVSLITTEQANAAQPGHYTDVVGRDDVGPLTPGGGEQPGPQAEDKDDDDDKPKSRRKK